MAFIFKTTECCIHLRQFRKLLEDIRTRGPAAQSLQPVIILLRLARPVTAFARGFNKQTDGARGTLEVCDELIFIFQN